MKEKYFDFMRNLAGSIYLEYYITYLVSPILTGVKPSSLICLGNGDEILAAGQTSKVDCQYLKKYQAPTSCIMKISYSSKIY